MTETERADTAYKCFCEYADGAKLKYKGDDAERNILLKVVNDGFEAPLLFHADAENQRICVIGKMPFEIKKEKLSDFIMAINAVNCELASGAFCADREKYYCSFESNEIFAGITEFGTEFAERVMLAACGAVIEYGRSFMDLNDGKISAQELIERI